MIIKLKNTFHKTDYEFKNKAELADFCNNTVDDIGRFEEVFDKPQSRWTIDNYIDTLPYCEYVRL